MWGPADAAVNAGPNDPLPCGFGRTISGSVAVSGRTVAQFVQTLSDLARRPVIDKTGLTGRYDFALKFAPDTAGSAIPLGLPPSTTPAVIDPDAPSLFTAVQEQLGLKLESARGPSGGRGHRQAGEANTRLAGRSEPVTAWRPSLVLSGRADHARLGSRSPGRALCTDKLRRTAVPAQIGPATARRPQEDDREGLIRAERSTRS